MASDDDRSVYRLNFETGELDVFLEDSRKNVGQFTMNYSAADLFSGEQGTLHALGNRYIVSFSGSGQVFEISFKDSSITRLDGTYQHGYNFDAYQFVRDGILYSFGGYGFWMENNMLNRFDEVAREWFHTSKAPFPVEVDNKAESAICVGTIARGYVICQWYRTYMRMISRRTIGRRWGDLMLDYTNLMLHTLM